MFSFEFVLGEMTQVDWFCSVTLSSCSEDDILKELEELSIEAQGGKGKVSAATKSTQFNHRFCSEAHGQKMKHV